MKFLKYFFLTMMFSFLASWQTAFAVTIKGYIFDLQSHQPIAGASVRTDSFQYIAQTNDSGYFEIKTKDSKGQLTVSVAGYKTQVVAYKSANQELNVQLRPDPYSIGEVQVSAFGSTKSLKETSGAVALLTGAQIRSGSGVSLQSALNSVPGVRMDQSNLADSRISIRGNGVRSPWGMRNVKVYINDIPLTEADGTTRIEALDVPNLGQAEIIKGPASSLYGGGTGGVIKFQLEHSPYQEQSLEASALGGSFGLGRLGLTYRGSSNTFNSFVSYGRQYYSGYREHSSDERKFLSANFQWFPSEKRMVTVLISRTSQYAEIPGTLTEQQMQENPRQAAAVNLEKDAGRNQVWTRVGIGQEYRINNGFTNHSSVFTYFYDLDHPLPFGIIRNFYQSYGGRTQFEWNPDFKILPTVFTFGGEFNQAFTKGTQYVNNHGTEGNIMSNTDYENTVFSLFLQSETKIGNVLKVAMGLSYNGMSYDVSDYLLPSSGGIKRFQPQASPRIAISHDFGAYLSLHGSVSYGFSPPTTDQIKNADQSINNSLQAERGVNYEIDAKGNLCKSRLSYDLSLFRMDMKGELIAQTISQGVTVYHNSGQTTHNGVEFSLNWQAVKESDNKIISILQPYLAITYSDFVFKKYEILNAENEIASSYNGNELTGIAPWVISAGFSLETRFGIYANTDFYFNDRQPLNDQNTDFNPAYSLLNAKVGYKTKLGKHFGVAIYAGLNNIFNEQYSSFTALNAIGYNGEAPAYFNPSPARNAYAGINFKYFLKTK